MHLKSNNVEIMMNDEADEVMEKVLNHSKKDIKIIYKSRCEVVSLTSVMFIHCIINVTKIQIKVDYLIK